MKTNNSQMAIHLDLSRERLRALVAEGVIEQLPGGGFDLDATRRRYIRWLRDRPVRSASNDALRDAKVKLVDLKIERERRTLLKKCYDEVIAWSAEANAHIVMSLDSLPARFTRDTAERKRLAEMIDDIRRSESEWMREQAAKARAEMK